MSTRCVTSRHQLLSLERTFAHFVKPRYTYRDAFGSPEPVPVALLCLTVIDRFNAFLHASFIDSLATLPSDFSSVKHDSSRIQFNNGSFNSTNRPSKSPLPKTPKHSPEGNHPSDLSFFKENSQVFIRIARCSITQVKLISRKN